MQSESGGTNVISEGVQDNIHDYISRCPVDIPNKSDANFSAF
jgi:hypothetical protein